MILRIALLGLFVVSVVAVGGLSEAGGMEEISHQEDVVEAQKLLTTFLPLTAVVDKESAWTGKILYSPDSGTNENGVDVFVEWTKDARNRDITDRGLKSYIPLERLVTAFDPGSPQDEKCLDEENKLCVGFTFFDIEDSWLGKIVDVDKTRQSASVQWVETSDGDNTGGANPLDQIFFEQMAIAEHGHCIDIEDSEYCVGQFLVYGRKSQSFDGGGERIIGEVMGVHEQEKEVIIHQIEPGGGEIDIDDLFINRRTSISPNHWKILDSQCAGSRNKEQYCRGEKVIDMRDLWEGEIVAIVNGQEDEDKEVVVKWDRVREKGLSLSLKGEADNKDIVPVKYLIIPREGQGKDLVRNHRSERL